MGAGADSGDLDEFLILPRISKLVIFTAKGEYVSEEREIQKVHTPFFATLVAIPARLDPERVLASHLILILPRMSKRVIFTAKGEYLSGGESVSGSEEGSYSRLIDFDITPPPCRDRDKGRGDPSCTFLHPFSTHSPPILTRSEVCRDQDDSV